MLTEDTAGRDRTGTHVEGAGVSVVTGVEAVSITCFWRFNNLIPAQVGAVCIGSGVAPQRAATITSGARDRSCDATGRAVTRRSLI